MNVQNNLRMANGNPTWFQLGAAGMLMLDHDGIRCCEERLDQRAGRTKTTIDLPADRVLRDSSLIDCVIAAVFDQFGSMAVEIRVVRE
jgi:hypothetical protein